MEFKPLSGAHVAQLSDIERCCFKTPWSASMLREELINPLAHYEVLEENGIVLAYGGYHKIIDEGHITNVAVLPARQHEGLGTKLLARMLDDMRRNGVIRTTLEVNEHNANAVRLYEKFGFKLSGRRPKYYEGVDDALIYWLEL